MKSYDIIVLGGGIVGTATAMALSGLPGFSIALLEAEHKLACHQTGNNSGVIHSGLYYKPGSMKAENCVSGRKALYAFCEEHDIPHERCGKLVVATHPSEIPHLDDLHQRGAGNGLEGLKRLRPEEIREYEPHVAGIDGLFVPDTGIVDFSAVTEAFADVFRANDGHVALDARLLHCRVSSREIILQTTSGDFSCRNLVNCCGLQSDRVAEMCGAKLDTRIIPFRGEYYKIHPERRHLVKNLIYPVPDPKFPFLGVHFTRMIDGEVEAGPNAVLAFKREGYKKNDISLKDIMDFSRFPGFWRMAAKHWKMGFHEFYRSFSKKAFVRALKRLIPEVDAGDVTPAGAGVRAQALDKNGNLLDDFSIVGHDHLIHVLNAPSPAATASISIGKKIADLALKQFDIKK